MALRIENTTKKKEIDTIFYLKQAGDTVQLCAKLEDDTGDWYVCTISKDGMLLHNGIEGGMGFKVGATGLIVCKSDGRK